MWQALGFFVARVWQLSVYFGGSHFHDCVFAINCLVWDIDLCLTKGDIVVSAGCGKSNIFLWVDF
jgi:hypothetical protein